MAELMGMNRTEALSHLRDYVGLTDYEAVTALGRAEAEQQFDMVIDPLAHAAVGKEPPVYRLATWDDGSFEIFSREPESGRAMGLPAMFGKDRDLADRELGQ